MLSSTILKLSIIVFIIALLYVATFEYILQKESDELESKVYPRFKQILYAGGLLLGLSLLMKLMETTGIIVPRAKCVRCGEKIPAGHIYCETHKVEAAHEFQEKNR